MKANVFPTRVRRGFALIVTLALMVLLSLLAVGLLSLSAVTLRSSGYGAAQKEAQANARMALMLAIGELQTYTGADTRVTASANIVDSSYPPVLGAWRSWEGKDHDQNTGRPIAPAYGTKNQPDSSGGRFLNWLVSTAATNSAPSISDAPSLIETSAKSDTVPLLADGSLQSADARQVHLVPTEALNGGRFAWWVSGENQKARLSQPYYPRADNAAGWADLEKSHSTPDPAQFGLESLLDDPEAYHPDPTSSAKPGGKALSLQTTALIVADNPSEPQFNFHDLSTTAVGLLTNTATGGWRKDLSILTEKWDQIYSAYPGGELPLFRYSPNVGATSSVPNPTVNTFDPEQSNFYPWSEYSQLGAIKYPMTYHTASASWKNLAYFATLYRNITYDESTNTAEAPFGWDTNISWHNGNTVPNSQFYKHYHEMSYDPVVARIQLIVQANAIPDPTPTQLAPQNNHRINLRLVPIVTLWNPYNATLSKKYVNGSSYVQDGGTPDANKDQDFGIGTQRSLPVTLSIINGTVPPTGGFANHFRLLNGGNSLTADGKLAGATTSTHYYDYQIPENIALGYNDTYFGDLRAFTAWMPLEFSLKPGEAKLYAPVTDVFGAWSAGLRLKNGYSVGDDFGAAIVPPKLIDPNNANTFKRLVKVPGRASSQLHATDQVRFAMKADRFSKVYSNTVTTLTGAGAFFSVGTSNWPVSLAAIQNGEVPKGTSYLRQIMATSVDSEWAAEYWPSNELDEIQANVSDLVPGGGNPDWTNIFSISFGPRLTFGAGYGNPQNRPTRGVLQSSPFVSNTLSIPEKKVNAHPVHNAYDISYNSMSLDGPLSPEAGTEGYIVSGFQSGEGLSRLIMAEIPLRPLSSLPELQSWNVRGSNPLPPYQYYLIGNSDATPLINQGDILPKAPETAVVSENLQHDDAYCANHLLFDDWFFSSIAPQPTTFGGSIAKDMETVYKDFLKGDDLLTNRSYRPVPEDQNLSPGAIDDRVDEIVNSPAGDGFLKVASRLEVWGMFNVNSTSVKAWRALLGHARQMQVAYYGADGIAHDTTEREHVASRFTVAADVKAGPDSGLGAIFPSGSEYAGFRTLTDPQLNELSEKIVEQVRNRGPFLSLAEFVNRQLNASDVDLAMTGALQAALNSLSDDPNAELKKAANKLSSKTLDPANPKLASAGYAFDTAAKGLSTHGFPGWIRQADILRPIAPVLSARDDTFTIRAYGDARDSDGNILAQAWCEATVQRTRDFVDPQDPSDSREPPTNSANQSFGRKYKMTSMRWLKENEV